MLTVTLYRPVGQKEMDLIVATDMKRFPPRLFWQPIFYPVCNEQYARELASEWNAKDEKNGNVGYVTRFQVDAAYLSQYETHIVGSRVHEEYWIPAEDLERFNDSIVGAIEVIGEYRG